MSMPSKIQMRVDFERPMMAAKEGGASQPLARGLSSNGLPQKRNV